MDTSVVKRGEVAREGDLIQLQPNEVEPSAHDTATTANTNSEYLAEKNNIDSSNTNAHAASKILDEKVTPSGLLDHPANPFADSVAHQSDTETAVTANPTDSSDNIHFTAGQQASQNLEGLDVDSGWDSDSAIGTNNWTSTNSVRSSVYAYREENGRRYHKFKEGKYLAPNDEAEQDRLDLQHHLFLLSLDGKLQCAPVEEIKGGIHNVLDIGTGTGIWAIDFASAYPAAHVIGTDLSPIQPQFVPPNCHFEVDDAEDPWVYSHKFHFIHGRCLASCFTSHLTVFRSAFENLRPGGWIEMQDFVFPYRCVDNSLEGTALKRWLESMKAASRALKMNIGKVPFYKRDMEECGFVDVEEKQVAWPIGSWPKDEKMKVLGAWCKQDVLEGLQAWSMAALTRGLGMKPEEVELLLMEVRNDINSRKLHVYIPIYFVYGRRPKSSDS